MAEHEFNVWAFGDAHVGTDLRKTGRRSLAEALAQSEVGGADGGPSFDWDIALNVGDMSGAHGSPEDDEGQEVVDQYGALQKHAREAVYDICGNHDRNAVGEPNALWFRRWLDPMGENTETSRVNAQRRPFAAEGTWERYSFRVGNLLFLMMSDVNEPTRKIGRGLLGGNPGGVVTGETFAWWKRMVESNPDSIIVSAHHYVLKNTTMASGEYEGYTKDEKGCWRMKYHGYYEEGTPKGASYLYWVDSKPDAQAFESYLDSRPEAVAMWLGGHTHSNPDDRTGGKSHIETKWGVHFLNVASLTRSHVSQSRPLSRLMTFTEGSDLVRVRCYMHTSEYAPQGWYAPAERVLKLPRPFRKQAAG
ncbi:metallophosphoesterase [Hydrogenophaga sp. BPS33]|uniref:metallophosphoesterase n=1 Tax=Hydrogenophaga sp. BPS33 TaxID=2651974 RepID=UPI00131F8913|nr:metallophosphoesterase [Hydrogenophaga sp. BPS33]QHE84624.1 hypothetical protein F9K07_06840 [Hydrogenophaga sp. BPS33]